MEKEKKLEKERLVCSVCNKSVDLTGAKSGVTSFLFRSFYCNCLNQSTEPNNEVEQSTSPEESPVNSSSESEKEAALLEEAQATLSEKYEVLSLLGKGGMGAVFKVRDKQSNQLYAAKIVKKELIEEQTVMRRFKLEAQAAKELDHQNLVSVFEHGIGSDGAPFIIMEYLDGTNLAEDLDKSGAFTKERALEMFLQITEALSHAHKKEVVHRDIKPENILLTKRGDQEIAKIVDFGIARVTAQSTRPTLSVTQTGEIFGSPLYMSPEQCIGNIQDERSDIYSLGCVMYEVLTGEAPLRGSNPVTTILKHINEEAKSPSEVLGKNKDATGIELVVMHCLEKQPADRYQSVTELNKDLQKVKNGEQVVIKKPLIKLADRKKRSAFMKQAASVFLVSAAIAGGGLLYMQHFGDPYAGKTPQELEILGYMQEHGAGTAVNYKKARELYERAAKGGNSSGYISLGLLYEAGKGVKKDNKKAAQYYKKAASMGDLMGYHNLAIKYERGIGVPQNMQKAFQLYKHSAQGGNGSSQVNLAKMYLDGRGTAKDVNKAFYWIKKASWHEIPEAYMAMGWHYSSGIGPDQDHSKAFRWYQKALQIGHKPALALIGHHYRFGQGTKIDYKEAATYFKAATDAGDPRGMIELGELYEAGLGVEKNYSEAFTLYKRAEGAGSPIASYKLGMMYKKGHAVKQNEETAQSYFKKAAAHIQGEAENGSTFHQKWLSELYQDGIGVKQSKTKAAQWFNKSQASTKAEHP